jgi:hypothetical protein
MGVIAAAGALLVVVDRGFDRLFASMPADGAAPRPSVSASPIPPALTPPPPPSAALPSSVRLFDGGYVVGSSRDVEAVLRAHAHGTRTGCEDPPPTAQSKARWAEAHAGGPRGPAFVDLLRGDDGTLATEVGSRLQDAIYGRGYAAMSRPEQNVYLVWALDLEVVDGGLDGFFVNSAGNCARRTMTALDEVGLSPEARALREVFAAFPDGGPAEDRGTRLDQLDVLGPRRDAWTRLGSVFEGASSSSAVAAYVRANAMAFSVR